LRPLRAAASPVYSGAMILPGNEVLLASLRACLPQVPAAIVAHDDSDITPPASAVRAAVLLPLIPGPEPALLLTRRTEHLARHSGQVSFPGGRSEPADLSPIETALRETREETGISPGFVTVAGYLDRYLTGTGFDIQPVVGILADGFALAPDTHEVAEIFQVPLAFLMDPANRRRESRVWQGRSRSFYAYRWGRHEIWGATAAIIVSLTERIGAISAP
jgi:8-oxo-dGTP pyrophosphatase MutT (NUDIX family)